MKLTRKQRQTLETALHHAKRAEKYVFKPDIAVCHRRTTATTTMDYARLDGKALFEVEREYGSDLCGLRDAVKILERFLSPDEVEVNNESEVV